MCEETHRTLAISLCGGGGGGGGGGGSRGQLLSTRVTETLETDHRECTQRCLLHLTFLIGRILKIETEIKMFLTTFTGVG